jgi:predicted dehydrogenase
MTRLPVAVVGVGHLGKEHARILAGMDEVELLGVVDPRAAQAEAVAQRCGTRAYTDHHALPPQVRAVVVAAPTGQHHAIACDFLERGVAVLAEKPLAATLEQADELVELAARHGALLQVGHVERFNPSFEELQRRPFRPKYVACERCSGFSGRSTDVGVVLDLMIHDLDLLLALVRAPVRRVEALGVAVLGGHEDLAQARLTFADGCVADLTASRVHPAVVRRMRLWGPEGFAGLDFARQHLSLMQPAEALRRGWLDSRRLDPVTLVALKAELFGRFLQSQELDCKTAGPDQLTRELQEFVSCVRDGGTPRVDGAAGRDALGLACRVVDSLNRHAWDGDVAGPAGSHQLPAPQGTLFSLPAQEAA